MTIQIKNVPYSLEILDLHREILPRDEAVKHDKAVKWWTATDTSTGELVGFAALTLQDNGTGAFLSMAGVRKSHRGLGIQKRLIKARVRYARKHSVRRCFTYTAPYNPASGNSLISCGFRLYCPEGLPVEDRWWCRWELDLVDN